MKRIIVNCGRLETRIAALENKKLVDLFIERTVERGGAPGNVYKARVTDVLPGMQAAFVDFGDERNGYLHVDDCVASTPYEDVAKRPNIRELVTQGQELLVQVTKEAVGTKGAKMTAKLSYPGRYLVYLPLESYVGISAKIKDEDERLRLREILVSLCDDSEGAIVRTIAEGVSEEDIRADFIFLRNEWKATQEKAKQVKPPELVHRDFELIPRIAREFLTDEIDEFIIDDANEYRKVIDQLSGSIPHIKERIKLHAHATNIFDYYEVEAELEKAIHRKVWLKSGGYIVIDQTEAFTSIDVNTGKFIGKQDLADTVFKTNWEAVDEIFRQLRLRDIGGIILVDFIDMRNPAHRQAILKEMKEKTKKERARTHVYGFTQLGLLEMTRKKARRTVVEILTRPCAACEGRGRIVSEMTIAGKLERDLREYQKSSNATAAFIAMGPQLASFFQGEDGQLGEEWEQRLGVKLFIQVDSDVAQQEYRLLCLGDIDEVRQRASNVSKEHRVIESKSP